MKPKKLYLYLISQSEEIGYDKYDSAVICAPDEETARDTHPNGYTGGGPIDWSSTSHYGTWAVSRVAVEVKLIGVAAPGVEIGVVCASFNAG